MEIIKTELDYISENDLKEEWVGNLVLKQNGVEGALVYYDPDEGICQERLSTKVTECLVGQITKVEELIRQIEKKPLLDDDVLKVIYTGKSAKEIIQLVKEGIC